MEILNLLGGASLVGNVSQMTSNQSASTEGANFYKQLMGVVSGEGATGSNELASNQAVQIANTQLLFNAQEMTGEELELMIEGLLDQLDQLNEQDLNEEQLNLLAALLEQITALVELISFSNEQAKPIVIQQNMLHQQQQLAVQATSSNNDLLVKLADQLLLLQQQLQNNSSKLLHGQPVEQLIAEQLKNVAGKMEQLMQSIQQKPNEASASAQSMFQNLETDPNPTSQATDHLARMAQQSVHKAAASSIATEQGNSATVTASAQSDVLGTVTATPEFQLKGDTVREFLMQMNRGAGGTSSAYVLADEFADTMKELVIQRFNVSSLNGLTEARLSLSPEHLGHVDVKISMQNGVMTAIFQTETAMAKDVLENQMIQLRASLAAQGITVEKIEVSQTQLASELNQEQKQGSSAKQQDDGNGKSREKETTFEEELLNNVASQELGFGRAVNEVV